MPNMGEGHSVATQRVKNSSYQKFAVFWTASRRDENQVSLTQIKGQNRMSNLLQVNNEKKGKDRGIGT